MPPYGEGGEGITSLRQFLRTPPEVEQIALISVDSVRVQADGQMAATATIESGGPDILGIPTGIPVVHIFEPGERYLIDEFMVPGDG